MDFRITQQMKSFFYKISNEKEAKSNTGGSTSYTPIKEMYHYYYLCLLIGIHFNKSKEIIKTDESTEGIKKDSLIRFSIMPDSFKNNIYHLWSIYINNKIDKKLVEKGDRKEILNFIESKFSKSQSFSDMSSDTIEDFNNYAQFGIDYLNEIFQEPPRYLNEFLEKYLKIFEKSK